MSESNIVPMQSNTTVQAVPGSEFALAVREVKAQAAAIHDLFKSVLKAETHYGVIPGTKKPVLFKSGAEKIGLLLHLAPSFKRECHWDGDHLTVTSECTLTGQKTSVVIAQAGAICTSKETKYAFRQATRECPECGRAAIIKGKAGYGGGWLCFEKKGGCGAKWKDDSDQAELFEAQDGKQKKNPNIADTYNTVFKMADKRAFVAAMLFGTACSDIFTQDVVSDGDDMEDETLAGAPKLEKITAAQHSRIAILAKEKAVGLDELKTVLQDQFGVASRKELSAEQASKLIEWLERIERPQGE